MSKISPILIKLKTTAVGMPLLYLGASVCFQMMSGNQAPITYWKSLIVATTRARSSLSAEHNSLAQLQEC